MTPLPTIAAWTCVAVLFLVSQGRAEEPWKVTTIEEPPYVTIKEGAHTPPNNDEYKGYIPDLLSKIAEKLKKKYNFHLVRDKHYGSKLDNGQWNGMIREVLDSTADLIAAPITISEVRKEVLDFTEPFMSFGTAILMKKPKDGEVKIKSFKDLADQHDIKYGAVKDGSTMNLIKTKAATDATYKKIHDAMINDQSLLVDTSKEGVKKVQDSKDGKYAVIIEEGTADYWVQQSPCDLVVVKVDTDKREYAFAVKKGSPLKSELDTIIKNLKAAGELDTLQKKWWPKGCSGAKSTLASALSMVVAVLVAGFLYKN